MRKPNKCQTCPFYGTGQGFVPAVLNKPSPILLVGEHPHSDDVRGIEYLGYDDRGNSIKRSTKPQPFLSYVGHKLETLGYADVNKDYMIRCLPPWKHSDQQLYDAAIHCNHAYREIPESTELIVAHGVMAWDGYLNQFLAHKDDYLPLHEWRGLLAPEEKTVTSLPVYGVSDLQKSAYDKTERYCAVHDWAKIPRILNKTWPIAEPTEVLNVTRTTESRDIDAFFTRYLESAITPLIIDTEYTVKDRFLRLFGCGYHTESDGEHYLQLYWSNSQNPDAPRKIVVDWMFDLAFDAREHQGFLFQNAAADNPVLDKNWRAYGTWGWPQNYHDTMLMHAKLQSELPHSLGFMESIYSHRAKKKHLAQQDELTYHLGDLSTTLDIYTQLKEQMTPNMTKVYQEQDLLVMPLVQWSKDNGIRIDHQKVEPLYAKLQDYMVHATQLARTYVGRGEFFNLNSDQQCKAQLYDIELFDVIKSRLTRKPTIAGDALLKLRQRFAKIENVWEVVDGEETWNPDKLESRIFEGQCHPLLECKAAFNWYEDKVAKYIRTQLFNEKGQKLLRVYPNISIHAQATGRHSTTDPPLAQWPDELQDLMTPDPGYMWIGGDYAGQEVWLYSAFIHDEKMLEALNAGYDTHTMAMCDFFDMEYPPDLGDPYYGAANQGWRERYGILGKKDPRRDWAKAGKLSLMYLKKADQMHLIPGSRSLGITPSGGLDSAMRFLERNPAIDACRKSVADLHPTEATSFSGRVRVFNEIGPKLLREYINAPQQMGGADLLNYTIIRVCHLAPKNIKYIYGVHDSFYFSIPVGLKDTLIPTIKAKVAEPYDVFGHTISFPVEWKQRESSIV